MAEERLLIPGLRPVYAGLAGLVEALMRAFCGLALMIHGVPKLLNPLGATEMVANIGFVPASLWSVLLSIVEPLSGLLLFLGFLTRPAAAAATVLLLVTVYFHWVLLGQGYMGSEKSLLWASVTLFFVIHGGRYLSVDRAIGRAV